MQRTADSLAALPPSMGRGAERRPGVQPPGGCRSRAGPSGGGGPAAARPAAQVSEGDERQQRRAGRRSAQAVMVESWTTSLDGGSASAVGPPSAGAAKGQAVEAVGHDERVGALREGGGRRSAARRPGASTEGRTPGFAPRAGSGSDRRAAQLRLADREVGISISAAPTRERIASHPRNEAAAGQPAPPAPPRRREQPPRPAQRVGQALNSLVARRGWSSSDRRQPHAGPHLDGEPLRQLLLHLVVRLGQLSAPLASAASAVAGSRPWPWRNAQARERSSVSSLVHGQLGTGQGQ